MSERLTSDTADNMQTNSEQPELPAGDSGLGTQKPKAVVCKEWLGRRLGIFFKRLRYYITESWRCESALEQMNKQYGPVRALWRDKDGQRAVLHHRRMSWWRKLPINIQAAWRDASRPND